MNPITQPIRSLPPGAQFEVDLDLIDEGKLRERLEAAVRETFAAVFNYWKKEGDTKAKGSVSLKMEFAAMGGSEKFVTITYDIDKKVPRAKFATEALVSPSGKMLCQPPGTNKAPAQLLMYDQWGRAIGAVDKATGEVKEVVAEQVGGGADAPQK